MAEEDAGSNTVWIALGGLLLLAVVGVLIGVFSGSGDANVEGIVTLDSKPVANAQVVFLGEEAKNKSPVMATTDEQGRYKLIGNTGRGVPKGKYKVSVIKMAMRDGVVPKGEKRLQATDAGLMMNFLPPVYAEHETSPLQFDLKGGSQTINLEMKLK